ncbi:TIM barrel protein [Paraglaciecola chathamensis]|uniref:Hydroxypyruvate isomerase n=1 Tax=Paraglaciecola agarilytica NO2 TaxID=1125747 RepID=A0ABQ0I0Y1_9ALTE|nr:TIM barrel protein [Paraglaciecola agarilytica]GAC02965.1 hydroxypyruvate isomerase [Paraglaciecola agarilytica NO2]
MDRRKFIRHSSLLGIVGTGLAACNVTDELFQTNEKCAPNILSFAERRHWLSSFSCNIEQWFRPIPFLDRINAAKALGFSAIEIWNPHQVKQGKSPNAIAQRAIDLNMRITSYSPGAPNFADPNNEKVFKRWLDVAIEAGKALNVSNFNLTGHKKIDGLTTQEMIKNYTRMLKWAAPRLESENMVATVEPYNPWNHKGHFIYGKEPALSICREVNSKSIKLNWDFFHMQRTNGNLITNLEEGFDQVEYIQLADAPGRNQPGSGEVAYGHILTRLRELGYQGFIGAEFFPKDKNALKAASDLAYLAKSVSLHPPRF